MIYVVAADQFPSCCGSHTRIRAHFSAVGDHPRDTIRGPQKRGFLNTLSVQSQYTGHIRTISRERTKTSDANRWSGEREQTSVIPPVMFKLQGAEAAWFWKSKVYFPHLPRKIQRLNNSSSRKMDQVQIQGSAGPHLRLFVSLWTEIRTSEQEIIYNTLYKAWLTPY